MASRIEAVFLLCYNIHIGNGKSFRMTKGRYNGGKQKRRKNK